MSQTADQLLSRLGFAPAETDTPTHVDSSQSHAVVEKISTPSRVPTIRKAAISFVATALIFVSAKALGDYVIDQMLDAYAARQLVGFDQPAPGYEALMSKADVEDIDEVTQGQ